VSGIDFRLGHHQAVRHTPTGKDSVTQKIGEGSDSVVYRATTKFEPAQSRAVKKIHRKYIHREEYIANEIQILKTLDHPGVIKVFEVFDDQEYISIVTE
jgi:calcium-dependent protein kinase